MTMNEKLMMLPIFKGIAEDALLQFLEKTHLNFKNYESGEVLISEGDECESLICILNGEVEESFHLSNDNITLTATYGIGRIIGLDRLFGMDTRYSHSVRAVSTCGIMEFSKAQFMQMVQNNQMCMLNFLNSLSYQCQCREKAFKDFSGFILEGQIARLLLLFTDKKCRDICIKVDSGEEQPRSRLRAIQKLVDAGLITISADERIKIISRSDFLDYAEDLSGGYRY